MHLDIYEGKDEVTSTNVGTNLRYLWSRVEYCSCTRSTWARCCRVSGSALNSSTRQIRSSIVWSNWF